MEIESWIYRDLKESQVGKKFAGRRARKNKEGERPVSVLKETGQSDRAKRQRGRKSRVRWESSVNERGSEPEKLNMAERPIENK